jgi:cell division septation protein DedD
MFSKIIAPVMMLVAPASLAQSALDFSYGVRTYSDSTCKEEVTDDGSGLSGYSMNQVEDDKHCYSHKGYSLKLTCGSDDTVRVNHWLDLTGRRTPCTGKSMAGETLMQDVPWESALAFFNGNCVWSAEHGKYGKLTVALPSHGFPKCDFTGASIRRLQTINGTNATGATPAPTAATPAPTAATPTPTAASTNATANTSAPTPAPAPTPTGTASGASIAGLSLCALTATIFAMIDTSVCKSSF